MVTGADIIVIWFLGTTGGGNAKCAPGVAAGAVNTGSIWTSGMFHDCNNALVLDVELEEER